MLTKDLVVKCNGMEADIEAVLGATAVRDDFIDIVFAIDNVFVALALGDVLVFDVIVVGGDFVLQSDTGICATIVVNDVSDACDSPFACESVILDLLVFDAANEGTSNVDVTVENVVLSVCLAIDGIFSVSVTMNID